MRARHKLRSKSAEEATADGPLRTALVISGGGPKGAFAVGVIKNLYERYRRNGWFSIVGGSSTGALIASAAAVLGGPEHLAREAMDTLIEGYTENRTEDLLKKNRILDYLHRRNCLNGTEPLRRLLFEKLRPEWFAYLQSESAPDCYVVYTDFRTGEKITVSPKDPGVDRERFIQATLASASVPVFMEPTIIDGDACFDGGVRDVLPIERALELGAERIIPVFLDPEKLEESVNDYGNLKEVAFRALTICLDEIVRNDYLQAKYLQTASAFRKELLARFGKNRRMKRAIQELCEREEYAALFGCGTGVVDILEGIRPDKLMTRDMLTFDPESMRQWLKWGEEKAAEVITADPFSFGTPILSAFCPAAKGGSR